MKFSHLHCHTQFSLLDGAADISKLFKKAKSDGMPAIAITDHGNMFGAFQFVAEASKHEGVKPIVGCEFYLVENRHERTFGKGKKDDRFHQLFLAKNAEGYRNLVKLCSTGYIEGFYSKYPRIDKSLVLQYHKGLIATTCCLGARVPQMILRHGEAEARKEFEWWLNIFGEDYYVELQRHSLREQEIVNDVLIRFAKEYNVKIIASNDSHYVEREDSNAHDILLCINTGEKQATPKMDDYTDEDSNKKNKRFAFPNNEFYFKNTSEMAQLFHDLPQAIDNTNEIVGKIDHLKLKKDILLPHFQVPPQYANQDEYLKDLTYKGAKERYRDLTPDIEERLNFELFTIKTMGFAGYFLIVSDFIKAGRDLGVFVGPGRGSAAGSAVAYCIGITNIDPIKYKLLFERFLNPDRKSMPDIDTDFDDEGRQKVIDYVVEKYGKNQVAHIATYGTMAAKMSIKDVARVMDLPLSESNALAKLVPEKPGIKLARVMKAPIHGEGSLEEKEGLNPEDLTNCEQLREVLNGSDLRAQVLKEALVLEGSVRGTGIHAAGIIIAPDDLTNILPVSTAKDVNLLITQFEGSVIEDAGVIKMDFLGLKTLTILKEALRLIKQNHGIDIDLDNIPLDDKKTYELYQRGETNGTFQFESTGMQKYLRDLKPDRFDDLIAMNALYRPGPLAYIPNFINRKHGLEAITYDLPEMEEYLADTYGICVTGDTLIYNPLTGNQIRIDELENQVNEFYVQGVNEDLETEFAPISYWVCNGKKAVVEVKLKNGASVKMTPDHKVLTENGWQEIGLLRGGDFIATPQTLETLATLKPNNKNIRWVEIESITPAGEELVYDITVEKIHNFVGNNVILHNCVYQEQVMLLSQKLANFSKGDADVLRKAMGKKQIAVLNKMKTQFLDGCAKNGLDLQKCEKTWTDWEAFASYAFNKSHSTCYAFVAYQTAYLKAHYPAEYMAAVLTNNSGNIEKVTFFMEECRNINIPVKGPDVNESEVKFSVNKKGEIRFALSAIKGVGEAAVEGLMEERKKNGIFADIFDFVRRMNLRTLNKRVIEGLVYAGGFDSFGISRATFFAPSDKYETFIEHLLRYGANYQDQQKNVGNSLFGGGSAASQEVMLPTPSVPKAEDWNLLQQLNFEREVVGIYLSGHPLDDYKLEIKTLKTCSLDEIEKFKGQKVKIAAFVISENHRVSKKGVGFGNFMLQDYKSSMEISLFNDDYEKYKHLLRAGASVYVEGEYKTKYNGDGYELRVKDVRLLASMSDTAAESVTLNIPIELINEILMRNLERILVENKGERRLKMCLIDKHNKQVLNLYSTDFKVAINSDFVSALEKEGLEYKLN